ncbi:MAG: hypothetical protein JWP01_1710 [Myxococcales bacterium]|nr:hypothetical protein [Myxococcales bacterium]
MAIDLIEELEKLVDELSAAAIDYALCGGLAVGVHGLPRATKDIDLLVMREDVPRVLEVAKRLGFDVPSRRMIFRAGKPDQHEMQRVSKLESGTDLLVSLDLLIVGPVHQAVWDTRTEVPWREATLWVVSREGLATMKRFAGRPQDLADISRLEGHDDDEDQS